ncbi:hypothetical protein BY996DRAFT_730407 [Phakopsora pachyrhizi]|nr:hypothetical protein BY996DRAFT_730407 [Phakopsora pachyrhizi]
MFLLFLFTILLLIDKDRTALNHMTFRLTQLTSRRASLLVDTYPIVIVVVVVILLPAEAIVGTTTTSRFFLINSPLLLLLLVIVHVSISIFLFLLFLQNLSLDVHIVLAVVVDQSNRLIYYHLHNLRCTPVHVYHRGAALDIFLFLVVCEFDYVSQLFNLTL